MNPKLKHFLLDLSTWITGSIGLVSLDPAYHAAKWVPVTCLLGGIVALGLKTFAIGDIPPTDNNKTSDTQKS